MKLIDIFNRLGKQKTFHTNQEAYVATENGTYHINSIRFDKYGDFWFEGSRVALRRLKYLVCM